MKQNNSLLTRLIVSSLSVFVAGWLLPGVQIDSFTTAVGIAIVLGLLNATLKPLLIVITIPITVMSLGLFLLIINAAMLNLAAWFVDDFIVEGFFDSVFGAIVVSLISWAGSAFISDDGKYVVIERR